MDRDYMLAMELQFEFANEMSLPENSSKNAKSRKKSVSLPKNTLVDPEWEKTDPNPDIHVLFQVFNNKYFWGKLDSVEVKWSPRMYSCAGITTYKGRFGGCTVSLSLPLLKLRPRKDLVETLLHEMIHAFLFIADNNKERAEHGPKFHAHMFRINREAGTNITVYHDFHDEVKHYKTHWWKCNGPCKDLQPFYGTVKRTMNRAPGPNDFWYEDHQRKCGGEFIKIKEPEGFKSRKRKNANKDESPVKVENKIGGLNKYFPISPKSGKVNSTINGNNILIASMDKFDKNKNIHGFTCPSNPKTNTGSNTVKVTDNHNLGSGRLKSNSGGTLLLNPQPSTSKTVHEINKKSETPVNEKIVPFSGIGRVLSFTHSVPDRSKGRLLNLYSNQNSTDNVSMSKFKSSPKKSKKISNERDPNQSSIVDHLLKPPSIVISSDSEDEPEYKADGLKSVHCPACDKEMSDKDISDHLDNCGNLSAIFETDPFEENGQIDLSTVKKNIIPCPCCDKDVDMDTLNTHLDVCAQINSENLSAIFESDPFEDHVVNQTNINKDTVKCPCCDNDVNINTINDHLDVCAQS